MFTQQDYRVIDRNYFNILELSPSYIRFQSKNTRHFWRIFAKGVNRNRRCLIQHSHGAYDGFHNHAEKNSLYGAINDVISHDTFQLSERRREKHTWDEYRPAELSI